MYDVVNFRAIRLVYWNHSYDRLVSTRSSLGTDLARIGIRQGDLLMIHAGLRSVGSITGGVNALVQALFDVIGGGGTLAAYVDFEPFYSEDCYASDIPVFDKRIAHAARDHGVLHETLRNWPGALRSDHPDAGVAAIGALAEWITAEHPFQYGYGQRSPFDKIVQAHGRVLLIGAPLDTITLLHHSEHLANIPGKRVHRYRRLMPGENGPVWMEFEEFDTREPVSHHLPENCFERIATDYLASGCGVQDRIGAATSFLFEAPSLVHFGVTWLERYDGESDEVSKSRETSKRNGEQ
jgi:aminoglycoside 3-N-acetyltransferase